MSSLFKKKVPPSHLATISRRRVVGGLLMVATPLSWVLASGSPLHAQSASADTWTPTGSLQQARAAHRATLLPNGRVLVVGGVIGNTVLSSAELYDPAIAAWTATGSMQSTRQGHTATLLPNGKVLVAGGLSATRSGTHLASAELYDPATGSMQTARVRHTATLLSTGRVLVAGGVGDTNGTRLSSAELYDPPAVPTPTRVPSTPTPGCVCGPPTPQPD